jgi:serine/threonine protein kinase/TolB-like protein
MIGSTISHYKIIEKLGEGGMGVVYKAHDTKLDRPVALKFLPQQITSSNEDKARFLQEARAASAVMHPNVCVIYDIAEHDGQQFIVMEYVDGKTLRQIVPVQKMQTAIDYAIQIGEALQEAHNKRIVHRDVKTDNIMVNTKNQVKVMDFGLAKLKGSLKLTKTSSTVGTLAYMPPEQIEGGEVDARSDIFSFGVVLYEMLTGHLPFRGEHEAAMMYSILNETPQPIQKYLPDVSSEVMHVINRALEKDPEDRYQSMHDIVIDLRRIKRETSKVSQQFSYLTKAGESEDGQQRATEKNPPLRKRTITIALGVASVLLVIGVVYVLLFDSPPRLAPKRIAVAVFENRTGDQALTELSTHITESAAQGLAGIGVVEVVPSDVAIRTWERVSSYSVGADIVDAFARELGAKLIVSGSFFKKGDSLQIHARVTDAETHQHVRVVGPISGSLKNQGAIIEQVRERLMGAVATLYEPLLAMLSDVPNYSPTYSWFVEFRVGADLLYRSRWDDAVTHLREASRRDTNIFTAMGLEAIAHHNAGRGTLADSIARALEQVRQRLPYYDALELDWLQAVISGKNAVRLKVSRQIAGKSPAIWGYNLGLDALALNQLREAQAAFSNINPYDSAMFGGGWYQYWSVLTLIHHLLGEHDRELKEAQKGCAQYPNLLSTLSYEMRALAARGRIEEIMKRFDHACTLPLQSGYTPAGMLIACASELRFHGFGDAVPRLTDAALSWYEARPDSQRQVLQSSIAYALYVAQRWKEAKEIYVSLSSRQPDNINYLGYLGTIAARQGDTTLARRIDTKLKNINRPYIYGNHTYWRARIAALLGEKEPAIRLLRDALAQGLSHSRMHADIGLESIWDYPPFKELLKPKD